MEIRILSLAVVMIMASCKSDVQQSSLGPITETEGKDDKIVSITSGKTFSKSSYFKKLSADELNLLLNDYEKPLETYPKIKRSSAKYGKDGLLYRVGINEPFSGMLVDESENGVVLLEVSFLKGKPHGQQVRRNNDGSLAMKAIFNHGVLTGTKTRWWANGFVKEEEYWANGKYNGRAEWDEIGRLIKEERVR